jgi:uncharacterized protein (TIGR02246 family)
MRNALFYVLLIAFSSLNLFAQDPELVLEKGVAPHKGIDAVYTEFSEAYKTLDTTKVTALYTENASYLPPNNNILKGRDEIRPTFQSFFDWIKKEGRTMTISFRIVQRMVDEKLGYDVGIYMIRQYKDGKEVSSGSGKFFVAAVREKDGKWRFQVDGYSDLKPPTKQ